MLQAVISESTHNSERAYIPYFSPRFICSTTLLFTTHCYTTQTV